MLPHPAFQKLQLILYDHFEEARSFLVIGVSNLVFTYLVYILVYIFASYTVAFTLSFGVGILFSAFLNSRYSFFTKLTTWRLTFFTFICFINYILGLTILKFFIEKLGIHEAAAPIFVVAAMVPISFVGTRLALGGSVTKGKRPYRENNSDQPSR